MRALRSPTLAHCPETVRAAFFDVYAPNAKVYGVGLRVSRTYLPDEDLERGQRGEKRPTAGVEGFYRPSTRRKGTGRAYGADSARTLACSRSAFGQPGPSTDRRDTGGAERLARFIRDHGRHPPLISEGVRSEHSCDQSGRTTFSLTTTRTSLRRNRCRFHGPNRRRTMLRTRPRLAPRDSTCLATGPATLLT